MKLKIVSTLLTSAINTGIVTLIITLVHGGLPFHVLPWLQTWLLAFCIIAPLGFVIPQRVRSFLSRFIPDETKADTEVTEKVGHRK